jgi:hypothetical protein
MDEIPPNEFDGLLDAVKEMERGEGVPAEVAFAGLGETRVVGQRPGFLTHAARPNARRHRGNHLLRASAFVCHPLSKRCLSRSSSRSPGL